MSTENGNNHRTSSSSSLNENHQKDAIKATLASLYKSITKKEISPEELEQRYQEVTKESTQEKHAFNEQMIADKIKMHLIHQKREKEAMKMSELGKKIRNNEILHNKGNLMEFMYSMFDKTATKECLRQRGSIQTPELGQNPLVKIRQSSSSAHSSGSNSSRKSNLLSSNPNPAIDLPLFNSSSPYGKSALVKTNSSTAVNHTQIIQVQSHQIPRTITHFQKSNMEKDITRELIYIFQDIPGKLIKEENGVYLIIPELPLCIKNHILRLCELGYFYKRMRSYCDKPISGLVAQGLRFAATNELQEFYHLLAFLQTQVQIETAETPSDEATSQTYLEMTLIKLGIWVFDSRQRLEFFNSIIDASCDKKGGDMCSTIYKYSLHGDPAVHQLANFVLGHSFKPIYLMICQWILYGELEDPFNEFFIAADSECKKDQLWDFKYYIRQKMIPSFISIKEANKILATGKNINFLKELCGTSGNYEGRAEIKTTLEKTPVECIFNKNSTILKNTFEKAYRTTSDLVLEVLIKESCLIDHLRAIRKYLLLGQGDFIQYLLELIQKELSKPASKLFSHNISAILESAIRTTNARFEDEDILNRLDTRLLSSSEKDLGWNVFCLDYKVQGPIGTVLTEEIMKRYNHIFNTLWRAKRIEIILSHLWKNQTALFKTLRLIPEIGPVLHRSQLLISEMIHFIHQNQYYIVFEATECAWVHLIKEVNMAKDLDQIKVAHSKFLDTITSRSLLDPANRELLNQQRGIFNTVLNLQSFLIELEGYVYKELEIRKNILNNSTEEDSSSGSAQKKFFSNYVVDAKAKIEALYTTTQDLIATFLLILNKQNDVILHCLSFRLDFNEYYEKKDSRLSEPLTLQHRRLSSNNFIPLNASMSNSGLFNITAGSDKFYEESEISE